MAKAFNIQWDIDIEEALDLLGDMTSSEAAKVLGISVSKYDSMTESELEDYASSYFHHCPGALDDLFDLPQVVNVPDYLTDDDEISDWLSDTYGFCHSGFSLDTDK